MIAKTVAQHRVWRYECDGKIGEATCPQRDSTVAGAFPPAGWTITATDQCFCPEHDPKKAGAAPTVPVAKPDTDVRPKVQKEKAKP